MSRLDVVERICRFKVLKTELMRSR